MNGSSGVFSSSGDPTVRLVGLHSLVHCVASVALPVGTLIVTALAEEPSYHVHLSCIQGLGDNLP